MNEHKFLKNKKTHAITFSPRIQNSKKLQNKIENRRNPEEFAHAKESQSQECRGQECEAVSARLVSGAQSAEEAIQRGFSPVLAATSGIKTYSSHKKWFNIIAHELGGLSRGFRAVLG